MRALGNHVDVLLQQEAQSYLSDGPAVLLSNLLQHRVAEEAILSAAKAYYLVSQIETDGITIEKYSSRQLERMKGWLFTDYEYTKLNKLKKSNPEAFFYLYLALHR